MESGLLTFAYLTASVLFILSLRGLSSQETARQGNLYGMLGMLVAVLATASSPEVTSYPQIGAVMGIAVILGAVMAVRVAMTGMPELVAILHSFVGLAAVLVGLAAYYDATEATGGSHGGTGQVILFIEIFIDVLIGAITFTGSVVAWGKLRGSITGKALVLPGRHLMNLALFIGCIVCAVWLVQSEGREGLQPLLITIALASVLGVHLVMAIGGADMPVVVSMLNSYSGWTAAAAGFMLSNDLLIITGALVGSSGAILSIIMCRAMNRSIVSVMLGGFGSSTAKAPAKPAGPAPEGEVSELDVDSMVELLTSAKDVMIIPGYGMARARAQHAIRDLTNSLQERGATVRFGIHPVAGRLPGHMNVLLAEADVPYDIVFEMDEINGDFPNVDVCLVLGANDIVNPGAETDESSPIYGMPVLKVWESKRVVICKRSRNVGYAGVDNPLFYHERASMLFGDAREMVETLVRAL
ncbi:MAG: NAD(P)(+) transhydrogenase (Re/Si-specific) subunit beta [Myxococcota bacterium]